jgi:zinc transport system ATP-binding protein
MTEPVIDVRNVWFTFNGQPVLEGVSMTVARGDFLVVIGPNGGGKTTLLKLMLGLLHPGRGTVRVFGLPPHQVAHRIGYVPQNVNINKTFPVSVMDVVLMGRLRSGRGWSRHTREDQLAAQAALDQMRVWEHRRRRIGELSGGQLQRVFIARALVLKPEMLFLDEAMASIDAQTRGELNRSVTIVAVSHDMMALSRHATSVACVNRDLHYHDSGEITQPMLDAAYACPVDLVAHGIPHRVLGRHEGT